MSHQHNKEKGNQNKGVNNMLAESEHLELVAISECKKVVGKSFEYVFTILKKSHFES